MTFLILAALATGTAAATVWLAETRPARENDPDSAFWYAFAGLCVLAPIILAPAFTSNAASLTLLFLSGVAAIATHLALRRRRGMAAEAARQGLLQAALTAAATQHQATLDHWACYVLDPETASRLPAMTNINRPETASLVRLLTATEELSPAPPLTHDGVAAYQHSVTELGRALATAEDAAARH
ncbi:hypothetical protein JOF48_003470 [Arthrobacter stackebrandtii]|uniref:Uncharacterized protein n=1 Tax=Arthrobacter stackebrandtii TaxID=272161 RepID=A0ABS4Z0S5_9MICC|nr:hypothetical protein [Arthrobacter stackebrandtii]MBP2414671.1 hypothetical protein [Arthrobacter stackebrandtii]PYH01764.1 hypothetical protein CVV67_04745 [Arthrobacter stackebrandtii]